MMLELLVTSMLGISVHEMIDGTEIGDAQQSISFESGGKYHAETEPGKGPKTTATGKWAVNGSSLEVKIDNCKGPACQGSMGKGFTADLAMVAERAMTVKSSAQEVPLNSGSYYCAYGGCEKRTGVLIVTHSAKPPVMKYLLDFLIDKNHGRDVTVVWWGKRIDDKVAQHELTYCNREAERGKKGAEQVAADLAQLPWMGALTPKPSADKDCLYDVRLLVKDDTPTPPAKR